MDIAAIIISSLTLLWTFISFFLLHKQSKEIQQLQKLECLTPTGLITAGIQPF